MGDRTYYTISLDASGLTDADLDALTATTEFDRWERDILVVNPDLPYDNPARITELPTVGIIVEEMYCGSSEEVASKVLTWMREEPAERLRAFTVQESPKYEWLGTLITFDPKLHGPESIGLPSDCREHDRPAYHMVECDDSGTALLSEDTAARLIAAADGSFEALVLALGEHYGPAFDGLVTAATAKHREAGTPTE